MTTETPTTAANEPEKAQKTPSKGTRGSSLSGLLEQKAPTSEAVLNSIEGQEVEIAGIEISEEKQGRRGKYQLAHITLSDGREFRVAGSGVCKPLSYVEDEDLPVFAVFERVPSDFEPGTYYWTVR